MGRKLALQGGMVNTDALLVFMEDQDNTRMSTWDEAGAGKRELSLQLNDAVS